MKSAVLLVFLTLSCSTVAGGPTARSGVGFDFERPRNAEEKQFARAVTLAKEIASLPDCASALARLPDWPPGEITVGWVSAWTDGSRTTLARTMWRPEGEHGPEIKPYIRIHQTIMQSRDVTQLAMILIHELVHAASVSMMDGITKDDGGYADVAEANERQAQQITGICARAGRIEI